MTTVNRRAFLVKASAAAGASAALAAAGGFPAARADGADATIFPFTGEHQAGITAAPAPHGLVMALDVRAEDRDELRSTLRDLSESIAKVMSGESYDARAPGFPPYDTGILGPNPGPTDTTVVVGFGDALFDDRFGFADRKPSELQRMMKFGNDYLVRPERSHGDVSITVSANSAEAVVHAQRQILRETRGRFIPRWSKEGFNDLRPDSGPGRAPGRNLMGFLDGTANLDATDPALMAERVWIAEHDDQPDWTVGGSYQVIRVIRMMAEFWDRTRLAEQEAIFGRHRYSGAPLGKSAEADEPEFGGDFESHIARANPRTTGSDKNLILRRGFNYASGFDENDQVDQGLIFACYQRSLVDGFMTVQGRLDGEVLEEYIRPLGGGFFFAPPAPAPGEYLGERLLD